MRYCTCVDWKPNIEELNGPIVLQSVRSGGSYQYGGKPFVFCPWCGSALAEETQVIGEFKVTENSIIDETGKSFPNSELSTYENPED